MELINEYRQANGAGPLVPSETLSTSAERHSEDMATYDFFSHESKDSSYYPAGSQPVDRAAQEGYPVDVADTGENIAWGQPTAEEVFQDWRRSPDHNANMLNKRYTVVGIGHVGAYWTADFGSVADPARLAGETTPDAEKTNAEQPSSKPQTPDAPASSREEQPGEAASATQPDKKARPSVGPEASPQTTDSSADPALPVSETPEPGQTSKPQTADQQPGSENVATRTPASARPIKNLGAEQYTVEGGSPSTETPLLSGEGQANRTPSETAPAEQVPASQPRVEQPAADQPADGNAETTPTTRPDEEASQTAPSTTPAPAGGATDQYKTDGETVPVEAPTPSPEEAAPRMASSAEPTTDGLAEQYRADGEASPADVTGSPSRDQATEEPAAEPVAQTPPTTPVEQQTGEATPAETGATQPLQAVPAYEPANAAQQRTYSSMEELSTRPPDTQQAPAAVAGGATSSSAPPAVKELPRTSGAPLPLFGGVMLVLSGLLIYGASRRDKGRS